MRRMSTTRAIALFGAIALGCGGEGDGGPVALPAPEQRAIEVILVDFVGIDDGYALTATGPIPPSFTAEAIGDCVLRRRAHCDSACDRGEYCTADRECAARPPFEDAGKVTVKASSSNITHVFGKGTQGYHDFEQAWSFAPGETVTARGTGADVPPFELTAAAPHEEPPIPDEVWGPGRPDLRRGEDFAIAWGDVHPASSVSLLLLADTLDMSVLCEKPDDGTLVVPAAFVDAVLDEQARPTPNVAASTLSRVNRSHVMLEDGRYAALQLRKELWFFLDPGGE